MGIIFVKPGTTPVQSVAPGPKKSEFEDHLGGSTLESTLGFANTTIEHETKGKYPVPPHVVFQKNEQVPTGVGPIPVDQLAHVSVGAKRTLNLGNYESAHVSIHLSFPSHVNNIDPIFEKVSDWVSGKMKASLPDAGKK